MDQFQNHISDVERTGPREGEDAADIKDPLWRSVWNEAGSIHRQAQAQL